MTKLLPTLAALALAAAVTLPSALQSPGAESEPRLPVTVLVVRHAEAEPSTADERDPALTEPGAERADALARLLAAADVTHLFASEYRRTRDTLAPLAARTGLAVAPRPARDHAGIAAELRALPPGSIAVVAGHSNTVPALVEALGGRIEGLETHPTHGALLGHDEHDRLFAVTLPGVPGAAPRAIELRYGAPADD